MSSSTTGMYTCKLCGFTTDVWKEMQKHRPGAYSTTCEGCLSQAREAMTTTEKVKHTGGPWEWEHSPATEHCIAVSSLKGPTVLCRYWYEDMPSDARLIAASPEMLSALEQIKSMVESTYCTPDAMDDPIWKEADAAIRRAKGE